MTGRLLRGLVLLGGAALGSGLSAAQDPVFNRYDVTGVDPTDTLNVRAEPSSSSAVVGEIPSVARGIRALGGRVVTGPSTWLEIQYLDTHGWVNGKFLAPAPSRRVDLQLPLRCAGTEPFWGLSVDGGAMHFKRLDSQFAFVAEGPTRSANSTQVWSFQIKNGDGADSGVVFVRATGNCSDGMSDRIYDFEVMFSLPDAGGVFSGCCT